MFAKPFPILLILPLDPGEAIAASGLIGRMVKELPGARFTIVTGPRTAPLFANVPELDRLITVDQYGGVFLKFGLWRQLRPRKWGLILDLVGLGLARWLKRQRRAERRAHPTENLTVAAARMVGFEDDPPAPALYGDPEADLAARKALEGDGAILAIGPGAEWVGRCWPGERYGQLAAQLMLAEGAPMANARIVAFGSEADRDALQAAIFPLPRKRIIQRPYNQRLTTDYAWLKQCRLYVGGDNIWTQLAAAAGVPTVAIFGPSDDRVVAPYGDHVRVVRGTKDYQTLKALDPDFAQQVSHLTDLPVEWVLTAARGSLLKPRDHE